MAGSEFGPKRLNRRDFLLRFASLATAGTLAACFPQTPTITEESPPPEIAKPTKIPTETPKPIPKVQVVPSPSATMVITATPEPTKKPTSVAKISPMVEQSPTTPFKQTKAPTSELTKTPTTEPPRLLEKIEIAIPGLKVEKYSVDFPDITREIPESYRQRLQEWLPQPEFYQWGVKEQFTQSGFSNFEEQCGSSFRGVEFFGMKDIEFLAGHNSKELCFYFDGNKGRFFTFTVVSDYFWGRITDNEKRELQWPEGTVYAAPGERYGRMSLSYDGKNLYTVCNDAKTTKERKYALIIADFSKGTETIIRDSHQGLIEGKLSSDGSELLLSFPHDEDHKRGTYLINLKDWHVQFQFDQPAETMFINEDGSRLYLEVPGNYYLCNTTTGEKEQVRWPDVLSLYTTIPSRNLKYIARLVGIFPAATWVEGQWGTMVYTPEGFFLIRYPKRSLPPSKVDDNGNIYTTRGEVLLLQNGTYKLVISSGKEIAGLVVSKFVK